jgi:hypothetical protein
MKIIAAEKINQRKSVFSLNGIKIIFYSFNKGPITT